MRHAREVDDDRFATDILAEREGKPRVSLLEVGGFEQLAEQNDLTTIVGELDTDGVAAWHDGDAGRDRAHRARNVVGKADHARGLGARRRLKLIKGDHGAWPDIGDFALDAEIL